MQSPFFTKELQRNTEETPKDYRRNTKQGENSGVVWWGLDSGYGCDEVLGIFLLGVVVDIVGCAALHDLASLHNHDAVAEKTDHT